MIEPLSPAVRARIETYLDAVEDRLRAADVARERRRGIADDLEAQIRDSLAGLGREATPADAEAVLAGLDSPAAYADVAGPADAAVRLPPSADAVLPRFSCDARRGLWFLAIAVVGTVLLLAGFVVHAEPAYRYSTVPASARLPSGVTQTMASPTGGPDGGPLMTYQQTGQTWAMVATTVPALLAAVGWVGATACGWTAAWRIGRARGRLVGTFAAGVEALPMTIVLSYLFAGIVTTLAVQAYDGTSDYNDRREALSMLGCVFFGSVLAGTSVILFVRTARGPRPVPAVA